MEKLIQMSAAELARQIATQQVTVTDVVEAHIQRIEHVNPLINAVITPMFQQARQQAHQADQHIANHGNDTLPPLFGVPVTIKDCWAVDGIRFTGGSTYHEHDIADTDAEVVRRFKQAGAIILGKTNLPDMCWSGETVNPIFGRTNNPHDVNYSAGGSSGGEGAIIAAGGSPLGIGSDIAGSVRIPAAMNGCVSIKPTSGRVPSHDHFPVAAKPIRDWNHAGLLARRIEDLALGMDVLSETPMDDYRAVELADRRCVVYLYAQGIFPPIRRSVVETISMAAGSLQTAGMSTMRNDALPLDDLTTLFTYLMSKHGNQAFREALGGGTAYNLQEELKKARKGNKRISFNVMWFTQSIDVAAPIAHLTGNTSFDKLEQYKQTILDAMGAGGVLLCPLLITPPLKHGWIYSLIKHIPYSTPFNALGFPAVIVPVGYNDDGLPMTVQVVARPGEDHVALAVAAELERIYGGWRMAKL